MNASRLHPLRTGGLLLALAVPATAKAEPALADPTRPPMSAPALRAAVRLAPASVAAEPLPHLQSIQRSIDGPSSVLVDGRVVRVGERVGESTLVAIERDGVTLRQGRVDRRLMLIPESGKTVAAAPNAAFPSALAAMSKGPR